MNTKRNDRSQTSTPPVSQASSNDPALAQALANLEATLRQEHADRNSIARACYGASACEGVKLKNLQIAVLEKFAWNVSKPELHRLCSAGRVLSLSQFTQFSTAFENLGVDRLAILSRLSSAKLSRAIASGKIGEKDLFKLTRVELRSAVNENSFGPTTEEKPAENKLDLAMLALKVDQAIDAVFKLNPHPWDIRMLLHDGIQKAFSEAISERA